MGYFFSTFLGCLIVFNALLGSVPEVDLLMLFTLEMIVQGELHKVVSANCLSANSVTLINRLMITAYYSCRINRCIRCN